MAHEHDDPRHGHGHGHGHGHENDQGIRGALRYLRWLPEMWRSAVNDAVVDHIDPQPGELVVDIGAGMGAGAMRVAQRGARVLAVEPTPFMRRLLLLRRTLSRHRGRWTVAIGAAERIPAADASADAIMAVNTMHHWVDADGGAAEIARVLRPGGRLLLVDEVFTDPTHPEFERFGADHGDGHGGDDHHGFTLVDAHEMGARLQAAGLTAVDAGNDQVAGRPAVRITAQGAPATGP